MIQQPSFPQSLTKLVSIWLNVSLLFVSGQAVVSYGVLAGFLITGAFLLAFILFIPILWLYRSKMLFDSFLTKLLSKLVSLEILVINLLIAGMIIKAASMYESPLFLFSIAFILTVAAYLLRNHLKLELVKLAILLGLAILLPNYIFLQKGLETVYHNLLHYHPRFIHLEQDGAAFFFLLLTAGFFSKMFAHLPMIGQYLEGNFFRGIQKLFVGSVIWSTIILAFSSMTLVSVINTKSFKHENQLLFYMLEQQVEEVFLVFVFIALFISILIEGSKSTQSLFQGKSIFTFINFGAAAALVAYFYLSGTSFISIFLLFGGINSIFCLAHLVFVLLRHKNIKTRNVDIN